MSKVELEVTAGNQETCKWNKLAVYFFLESEK